MRELDKKKLELLEAIKNWFTERARRTREDEKRRVSRRFGLGWYEHTLIISSRKTSRFDIIFTIKELVRTGWKFKIRTQVIHGGLNVHGGNYYDN